MARVAAVTALAALLATAANVALRALAVAALDIPGAFEPLELRAVALSTLGGVLAAGLVFALLPRRAFVIVAVIALVASMWAPLSLGLADPPEHPGTDAGSVGTLMVMHVVAAAIAVPLLLRLSPAGR